MALTTFGLLHTIGASVGLVTGAFQLVRPQRDTLHRRVGYVFVGAMAVANVSALTVYEFSGRFNIFHALALYNLIGVTLALRPMWMRPRPNQWRRIHYMWIAWSYAGLCAAAITEFLLRVVHVPGWLSAIIGTPPVIILAWVLIRRYAPVVCALQEPRQEPLPPPRAQ